MERAQSLLPLNPVRQPIALNDSQRMAWLRLFRSEGIGPRTFFGLINRFGSAGAALDALPSLSREKLGKRIEIFPVAEAEQELAMLSRRGARLVARGEAGYPGLLGDIADAPPLLSVLGTNQLEPKPCISIVGSRNASVLGLKMAERLTVDLAAAGFVVVSGLARGIDTAVHKASLASGTVGIVAGGLDRIYPPENTNLFKYIADSGQVISEMPLNWEPRGRDFPRRNRIISGMSYAVIVVEAAEKSGSLITARFALEQGREVFAVPGSPLDPRAGGTNRLIQRQEAHLCLSAEQVIESVQPMLEPGWGEKVRGLDETQTIETAPLWEEWPELLGGERADPWPVPHVELQPAVFYEGARGEAEQQKQDRLRPQILAALSPVPVPRTDIATSLGLPDRVVRIILTELELEGRVRSDGSDRVFIPPEAAGAWQDGQAQSGG
jgi:DNA processing protein